MRVTFTVTADLEPGRIPLEKLIRLVLDRLCDSVQWIEGVTIDVTHDGPADG